MSVTYVIASYSGVIRSRIGDKDPHLVLQKQLEVLHENIVPTSPLERVIVVCPEPREKRRSDYYEEKKWLEMFPQKGIKIDFLDYVGDNKDHSYDQWIQGCMHHLDTDYYIIIEDDYLIQPGNVVFCEQLVDKYKRCFPSNIGFLTTWAHAIPHVGYHSAISNGLLSRDTIMAFGDMLQEYYSLKKRLSDRESFCQIAFSKLFFYFGIPIKDYIDEYSALFWESSRRDLRQYGNPKGVDIFIPEQALYTPKPLKQSTL